MNQIALAAARRSVEIEEAGVAVGKIDQAAIRMHVNGAGTLAWPHVAGIGERLLHEHRRRREHTVAVDFVNDLCGGTGDADRNLYVSSADVNGQQIGGAAPLYSNGEVLFHFTVSNHQVAAA